MNRFTPSEQKTGQPVAYTNAKGVDSAIESLREGLASVAWIDRAYGRAYDQYRDDQRGKYVYPAVWQGKSVDLLDVLENDNVNCLCYFRPIDPETPAEEYEDQEEADNRLQRRVLLTVAIQDIENLTGFTSEDHRYIDTLKNEVRSVIKANSFPKGVEWYFEKSWDEPKNVLKGYTYDLFERRLTQHPCLVFVIELKFTYFENANFCSKLG